MFVFKFDRVRNDQLIRRVKVEGPFITFYVANKDMNKFDQAYASKIKKHYEFLWFGESTMHDYAHGKINKHMESFFKKNKSEHFHVICPEMANMNNLLELLSYFSENDLNQAEKKQISDAFQKYMTQPNLDRLITTVEGYGRIFGALAYDDAIINKRMPTLCNIIHASNKIKKNQVDSQLTVDCGNFTVNAKKFFTGMDLIIDQLSIVKDITNLLKKYKSKEIDINDLISQLQQQFDAAASKEIVNFGDVFPNIQSEVKTNFAYEKFEMLYAVTAKELSQLLNTEIKFTPRVPNNIEQFSAVTEKRLSCTIM